MQYAIDIRSLKVQQAMRALNISRDELKLTPPSSGLLDPIQQLRYRHHTAKSSSLASKINEFMQKSTPTTPYTSKNSITLTSKSKFRENHKKLTEETYKKGILNFYEFQKSLRKTEQALLDKIENETKPEIKLQDFIKEQKEKNEARIKRHRENLKSLGAVKSEKEVNLHKEKALTPGNSRERSFNDKTFIVNTSEDDVEGRLKMINRKINKSCENYRKIIKEKVMKVKEKSRKIEHNASCSLDMVKLISEIKEKHDNANTRRDMLKTEFYGKVITREARSIEKFNRIKNLTKQEIQKIDRKQKILNEKLMKKSEFIEKVKRKQRNQVELWKERHKLLEGDVARNINRLKYIENVKKEKIIDKHLEIEDRQRMKSERLDVDNERARQKAMGFTIKKEKFYQLKAKIAQSRTPEKFEKIIKLTEE